MVTEAFVMSAFGLSRLQEADQLQHRSIVYFTIECMFSVTVYLMFSINHVKLRKPVVHAQESCQDLLGHENYNVYIIHITTGVWAVPSPAYVFTECQNNRNKRSATGAVCFAFIPTVTTRTRSPLCLTSDAVATSWKPAYGTTE